MVKYKFNVGDIVKYSGCSTEGTASVEVVVMERYPEWSPGNGIRPAYTVNTPLGLRFVLEKWLERVSPELPSQSKTYPQTKSSDFIVGYLYAHTERRVLKMLKSNESIVRVKDDLCVPKVWFNTSPSSEPTVRPAKYIEDYIISQLTEKLSLTFHHLDFKVTVSPFRQYMRFDIVMERSNNIYKEVTPKDMTLSDIEKELGYPVRIIP